MTTNDAIILHFEEIRRRSSILWEGLPREFYEWRPDAKAFSCFGLIRHVLETENIYTHIIKKRGDPGDVKSPWKDKPYTSIKEELVYAAPYRNEFLETIRGFSNEELFSDNIVRKDRKTRKLVDFLFRCAYHESVHAGQFLSFLRMLQIDRPNIWD